MEGNINNKAQDSSNIVVEEKRKNTSHLELHDAFAKGLPEWSLEPPQVVVRRKR